jgi:hypothetical protein
MGTAEEIAWAAGLFEGEGCFTHAHGLVNARLQMTDLDILERFGRIAGVGYIYGPYEYEGGRAQRGSLAGCGWRTAMTAQEVVRLLAPWLGDRRLRRAEELGLFPIRESGRR